MSNELPTPGPDFLGWPTPCEGDECCSMVRAEEGTSMTVGTCRFCGWASCLCGAPVCEPGDLCRECGTPEARLEAQRWAVEMALGGGDEEEEAETLAERTLSDAELRDLQLADAEIRKAA